MVASVDPGALPPAIVRRTRRRLWFWGGCGLALILACWLALSMARAQSLMRFRVYDQAIAHIDDRLFGQFLERASWGEPGPEVALQPGTRHIQPAAVALMKEMNIPLIRFPGGTDVDFIDWRDLISNVPGRGRERPITIGHRGQEITNQFGLDEYFQLRDQLGVETILVVNVLDALARRQPLAAAAQQAAGLVAYVNVPVGTTLPPGMPDWPAVRQANGHPEPYRVEYIQIGNEIWMGGFRQRVQAGTGLSDPAALAQWYVQCLRAYIQAIDAVDPNVNLILDGTLGWEMEQTVLSDPLLRRRIKYLAFHRYAPGRVQAVTQDGQPVPLRSLSAADWWYAWVAMPGHFSSASGVNEGVAPQIQLAQSLGYQVAVTEWNWNGWGFDALAPPPALDWPVAAGIGAAGFLNGLMRHGDQIAIACQSLLIGATWDITSIRVDPTAQTRPYFLPQGQVTRLYSNHHGSTLLKVDASEVPRYRQPLAMGWTQSPKAEIAWVDLVVTADDDRIYVHAINRKFDEDLAISLDLSALPALDRWAIQYGFTQPLAPNPDRRLQAGKITQTPLPVRHNRLRVRLPQRSVSIVEIPRV